MITKAIHFIGAVLVMGFTWFLVLFAALDWLAPTLLVDGRGVILAIACFSLAIYPAWRLYVQRRP